MRTSASPQEAIAILSVSPHEVDHSYLQKVFDSPRWALRKADGLASALSVLYRERIGVVLCERDLLPNTWIDLLERLKVLRNGPPMIVTSRLADERLWAEALNLGAYDVLGKPFIVRELLRSVRLAWLHWSSREIPAGMPMKAMTAAHG